MDKEYITERGVTIGVCPIPLLLEEIRKSQQAKIPPVPTYKAKTVGGGVEVHKHDEKSLRTDEEKAAWAEYEMARAKVEDETSDIIWRAVRLKAIKVTLPESDDWILDQLDLGLTVPEDARERRLHYIQTEVIGGMRDIIKITGIANGSDLTDEVLAAAEDSFRGAMAGQMERSLKEKQKPQGLDNGSGGLADRNEDDSNADGGEVGEVAV